MELISEDTLQQVEDVMRGIAVPPYEGWLGQTVADLCRQVRTLQTERAALVAYTQAQKDQAWDHWTACRNASNVDGARHWAGQRAAYGDILLKLTAEPAQPTTTFDFMDELARISQEMGDYD